MNIRPGQINMRSTLPEFFNTGRSLHFSQSRAKLAAVFMMLIAMTGLLCVLGYDWIPNPFSERFREKLRFMGPFFGLVTLPCILYLLANSGKKGVVLTRVGVVDHRTGSQVIPWHRIEDVSEGGSRSSQFVILRLADASDAPRSLFQTLNSMLLRLDDDERMISAAGLNVGHERLFEAIFAGWHASRHPPPTPGGGRMIGTPRAREFGRR